MSTKPSVSNYNLEHSQFKAQTSFADVVKSNDVEKMLQYLYTQNRLKDTQDVLTLLGKL